MCPPTHGVGVVSIYMEGSLRHSFYLPVIENFPTSHFVILFSSLSAPMNEALIFMANVPS